MISEIGKLDGSPMFSTEQVNNPPFTIKTQQKLKTYILILSKIVLI